VLATHIHVTWLAEIFILQSSKNRNCSFSLMLCS